MAKCSRLTRGARSTQGGASSADDSGGIQCKPKGLRVTTAPSLAAASVSTPPDPCLMHVRELVYRVAGIFYPDNKLGLLQQGCTRRMKERQLQTLSEYVECLTVGTDRQVELIVLLNEITIGETCFFRDQAQLDALRRIVIPNILKAKLNGPRRRLRIWSAGCSTGEEPYTLRMLLLEEADGLLGNWPIEIIATDINQRSLVHARAAVYGEQSTRHVTPYYRQKYFFPLGEELQVSPLARMSVSFSRLNLSDDPGMNFIRNVDAIFCCNVLIYFDLTSKRRVLEHFYNNLSPHGYLFLGHSESLYGVSDEFRLIHLPGATAYMKTVPKGGEA